MVEVDGEEKRGMRDAAYLENRQWQVALEKGTGRLGNTKKKTVKDTIKSGHWKPGDNMTNNVGKDGTLFGGFTAVNPLESRNLFLPIHRGSIVWVRCNGEMSNLSIIIYEGIVVAFSLSISRVFLPWCCRVTES